MIITPIKLFEVKKLRQKKKNMKEVRHDECEKHLSLFNFAILQANNKVDNTLTQMHQKLVL